MRRFSVSSSGCREKPDRASIKIQSAVRPGKTFEQPASEKSGGARDQDALAAQFLPQGLGSLEDAVEILSQPICHGCLRMSG